MMGKSVVIELIELGKTMPSSASRWTMEGDPEAMSGILELVSPRFRTFCFISAADADDVEHRLGSPTSVSVMSSRVGVGKEPCN